MLYVIHVQTEVEDECENMCEVPAIFADREKALKRAKSDALGILDRIVKDEVEQHECGPSLKLDVITLPTSPEPMGYRVMDTETSYWHASVEVLSVADVDLTEPVEDPGCEICGGPSH